MTADNASVTVRIFALPMDACDPAKTWRSAAEMIARRLREKYGRSIETEFVEIFTPESFEHPDILSLLEKGDDVPPYVTVNGALVQSGGKLSERRIREQLELMGISLIPQK
ncbi:MAG: hypothetical protein WEB62_11585 [Bacteroidota bacterium]